MRRILLVDDDPHTCLAIRAWLERYGFRISIADGGANGLAALDNATFVDDRRRLHARHARLRIDQEIPRSGTRGAVDRDFRLCLLRPRDVRSRLPEAGTKTWCDAMPAQAFQASDIVCRYRPMPVGSRTASKVCCEPRHRCERGFGAAGQDAIAERIKGRSRCALSHRASFVRNPCQIWRCKKVWPCCEM